VNGTNAGAACTVASQCPGGACASFCSTTAGICGGLTGQRCTGGTNQGAPCSVASQCPGAGGGCGIPGQATAFNACDALDQHCYPTNTCVGGTNQNAYCSDPSECPGGACTAGNHGVCAGIGGPHDGYCGPIGTFKGCLAGDSDCKSLNACVGGGNAGNACFADSMCPGGTCMSLLGGVAETCIAGFNRPCFLDDGVVGGADVATGLVSAPVHDVANPTLASLFCVGPTSSGSVNSAAGLPGLGRLELLGIAKGLP
jgi:hypothetical protein